MTTYICQSVNHEGSPDCVTNMVRANDHRDALKIQIGLLIGYDDPARGSLTIDEWLSMNSEADVVERLHMWVYPIDNDDCWEHRILRME